MKSFNATRITICLIPRSVLLLVGLLPVVVVRFEHESVPAREHYIAQPQHEGNEWQKGPVLPQGTSQNHHYYRDREQPEPSLVTVRTIHFCLFLLIINPINISNVWRTLPLPQRI